jgi:hypothetical protein
MYIVYTKEKKFLHKCTIISIAQFLLLAVFAAWLKRQCRGPLPTQKSKDDKDKIRFCSLVKRGYKKMMQEHWFLMFFLGFEKKYFMNFERVIFILMSDLQGNLLKMESVNLHGAYKIFSSNVKVF